MPCQWSTCAFSAEAVRAAEERAFTHATEAELMDRAAQAVAREAIAELRGRHGHMAESHVVLLVGAGKNGGDALLAGAHVRRTGAEVTAILCASSAFTPALEDFRRAQGHIIHAFDADTTPASAALARADVVIDGVAGLGASAGLREPTLSLVTDIPADAVVIAVDLPSGLTTDSGEAPSPYVRADITVTFSGLKTCHMVPPSALACGRVVVAEVGIPLNASGAIDNLCRATAEDVKALWPVPDLHDHKYSRGVVGVVAGTRAYPGAAVLAVTSAWRTGAGMVRYVGPERVQDLVLQARPETVCHDPEDESVHVQSWVLGPGLADDPLQNSAMVRALESGVPSVLDAGAITPGLVHRVEHRGSDSSAVPVATPHAGELAAALQALDIHATRNDVESRPAHYATMLARTADCVVVLKGNVTLICDPQGTVISQPAGPAWLATAGAGDVLAGIIGTLLASGLAPVDAAVMAVFIHAEAATAASDGGPMVAMDVADALPRVISRLLAQAI